MVTFAPNATGDAVTSVVIDLGDAGLVVPLHGRGTRAIPSLCFKFDDTGLETCTDDVNTALSINAGALCDNRVNTCTPLTSHSFCC